MMNPPDHRPPTHRRTDSIALGEDDALGAGIAGEGADARFFFAEKIIEGDAADRDFQFFFDLRFGLGTAGPVSERESAVDFRAGFVFGVSPEF
jgi:hypothetical protein